MIRRVSYLSYLTGIPMHEASLCEVIIVRVELGDGLQFELVLEFELVLARWKGKRAAVIR